MSGFILEILDCSREPAVLDHVGRAPLARDGGVVAEVPPEVVRQLLRAAVELPRPFTEKVSWSMMKTPPGAFPSGAPRALT